MDPTVHEEDPAHRKTVDAIYQDQLDRGTVVDGSAPLSDVVETFELREGVEAIFVVDPRERYQGVITRLDLLRWLENELAAPQLQDAFPWDRLAEAAEQARAEVAMNPKSHEAPVEPSEPVEHALRKMLAASLTVIPVVTPDGSLQGQLTLARALEDVL